MNIAVAIAAAPPAPFDLASIKPPRGQMDGSGKFSPNLYRWMLRQGPAAAGMRVYHTRNGILYIGRFDEQGWFVGAKLFRILCRGAGQERFAFMPKDAKGWREVKRFWPRYRKIGRCAIDAEHKAYFQNDEARWKTKGKTRHCQWCGNHKQRLRVRTKVTRTVEKTWRPV